MIFIIVAVNRCIDTVSNDGPCPVLAFIGSSERREWSSNRLHVRIRRNKAKQRESTFSIKYLMRFFEFTDTSNVDAGARLSETSKFQRLNAILAAGRRRITLFLVFPINIRSTMTYRSFSQHHKLHHNFPGNCITFAACVRIHLNWFALKDLHKTNYMSNTCTWTFFVNTCGE